MTRLTAVLRRWFDRLDGVDPDDDPSKDRGGVPFPGDVDEDLEPDDEIWPDETWIEEDYPI
jgi:hypothetical protein